MMDAVCLLSAGLEIFFALISLILLFGSFLEHNRKLPANRVMTALLLINCVMNALDACVWIWCNDPAMLGPVKALSLASYGLGLMFFALFSMLPLCYIRQQTEVPAWIGKAVAALAAAAMLMWALSLFNGMYYYWDEDGLCQLGELYFVSQLFGIAFLLFTIVLVLVYRKALRKKDFVVLVLFGTIPLCSFVFVPLWDVVPLYMAFTVSLLLYYLIIHAEHGQRAAQQQAQLARQELELNNSRTAIMLSQIQPHFLNNSLTAIARLCDTDPGLAKETAINFAEYLRCNLRALDRREPIPFSRELEHTKTYLAIEQVRFGACLHVLYDVKATDFYIPALCLQPLVENAVKHGVGAKEAGGTVKIATRELPDCYELLVSDDGPGFDPWHIPPDGRAHIGIENVSKRLDLLAGAALRIQSRPGEGTQAYITIPKKVALK